MTALRVRPTIRCLRDDLAIAKLPPADVLLDAIDHPILRKANASFPTADAPGERIAAIDTVLFKVKLRHRPCHDPREGAGHRHRQLVHRHHAAPPVRAR
jgi:hypothetical protein